MTIEIEGSAREQAAKYLPALIGKVLESYQEFLMLEEYEEDPEKEKRTRDKKFTDYHNAGKVALGHLDLLFKMAKSLGVDTTDSEKQLDEFKLQAGREVYAYRMANISDNNDNDY